MSLRSLPRITDVRAIPLRAPLERPLRMALGTMTVRHGMLVEVQTDAGLRGLGESWVNFPAWAAAERLATISQGLRPLLIGEVMDDPERLWRTCVSALRLLALQWGAPGPMFQAISGVDLALWDLAGKLAGVPVWQLLGASPQTELRAYASGLGPDRPEEQAAAAMADGFGGALWASAAPWMRMGQDAALQGGAPCGPPSEIPMKGCNDWVHWTGRSRW